MPNTREKLIELLDVGSSIANNICGGTACDDCDGHNNGCTLYHIADHLIANGVTFQTRDIHWATEQAYKNGYAKAVKDFAEKLKEKATKVELVCSGALVKTEYTISKENLENIAEEMVGADNG